MKTKNLENFEKLVSNENSSWLDSFLHYKANQKWLDNSSKIAINVLEALKDKKLSQKDLAEKMNVSAQQINKIVRGKQNLTFETIAKLETALEISLMEIIEYKAINEIKTNTTVFKPAKKTISEEIALEPLRIQLFSDNFKKKESAEMNVVYKNLNEPLDYKFTG
jgi:transcriptional regulator with XRE-family HTH domain